MELPITLQIQIEEGHFDDVEEAWLQHSSAHPHDYPYFATVAEALARHSEEERARFLLELLDESLQESQDWQHRLELLRLCGSWLFEPELLHSEILATLEHLHSDRPSLAGLTEAVGLHRATHDIPKSWTKVDRLEQLLLRDVGTVVAMAGKGVGRVVEANLQLGCFKVDFGGRNPLTVGFRAAPKMLELLPDGHILRRRIGEPEELCRLRDEDPSELLHAVLRSYESPRTAGEVREALGDIVSESRWSSWWAAARKHPQVVSHKRGGKHSYGWAESQDHALDAVWEAFLAATPRQRIDRFRKDGARQPELQQRMADELAASSSQLVATDPGLAFELRLALEQAGLGTLSDEGSTTRILDRDPTATWVGIQSRSAREDALDLLRTVRSDWAQLLLQLLPNESESRPLERGCQLLAEGAPDEYESFLDDLLNRARQVPAAFTWLAERAADDEALRGRWPLRLLRQLLAAIDHPAFQSHRSRLASLCESGGTLPRTLPLLDQGEATQLLESLGRVRSLPDYIKDPLVTAIELRFPELRQQETEQPLYALPASIQERRDELRHLLEKEIPANRKAIEEARALGDLRENFEYKSARQRHEYLNARVVTLNRRLERARPLKLSSIKTDRVRIGTTVVLQPTEGEPVRYTLLGPWESDPTRQVLSYESELGERLLGLETGQPIELGDQSFSVVAIELYGD